MESKNAQFTSVLCEIFKSNDGITPIVFQASHDVPGTSTDLTPDVICARGLRWVSELNSDDHFVSLRATLSTPPPSEINYNILNPHQYITFRYALTLCAKCTTHVHMTTYDNNLTLSNPAQFSSQTGYGRHFRNIETGRNAPFIPAATQLVGLYVEQLSQQRRTRFPKIIE